MWHLELALWEGVARPQAGSRGGILRYGSKVSSQSQRHSVAVTGAGYFGSGGGFVL